MKQLAITLGLTLIISLFLFGCGPSEDESDASSYPKIENAIRACGNKVQEIVALSNGSYGTTSAYDVVCKDGVFIHVDD